MKILIGMRQKIHVKYFDISFYMLLNQMKNKQPKTVDLTKFKKLWKTKKSLEQVEDKELWQEILKDYRPKTHKPQ